jgi:hypothetical protein
MHIGKDAPILHRLQNLYSKKDYIYEKDQSGFVQNFDFHQVNQQQKIRHNMKIKRPSNIHKLHTVWILKSSDLLEFNGKKKPGSNLAL